MTLVLRYITFALALFASFTFTPAFSAPAWKNQTVLITWDDNTTNETAFVIERSLDGYNFATLAQVGANVTAFFHTGLSPRTYYYRVYAVYPGGRTPASNVAVVTVYK